MPIRKRAMLAASAAIQPILAAKKTWFTHSNAFLLSVVDGPYSGRAIAPSTAALQHGVGTSMTGANPPPGVRMLVVCPW